MTVAPAEGELLQGYRAATPEVREILLDAARRAVKRRASAQRGFLRWPRPTRMACCGRDAPDKSAIIRWHNLFARP